MYVEFWAPTGSALERHRAVGVTRASYNFSSLRYLMRWSKALTAGQVRGAPLLPFYNLSFTVVYSCNDQEENVSLLCDESQIHKHFALVEGATLRRLTVLIPSRATVWLDARLLKILSSAPEPLLPLGISCLSISNTGDYCTLYEKNCSPVNSLDRRMKGIINYLTVDFVMKLSPQNLVFRSNVFDGYRTYLSTRLKMLAQQYLQTMGRLLGQSGPTNQLLVSSQLRTITINRLTRFLEEYELTEKIRCSPDECSSSETSVLKVSMSIFVDQCDRATVTCPLTPLVFPLILALDNLFDASLTVLLNSHLSPDHPLLGLID